MKNNEKEALLTYLEFGLLKLVEQFETKITDPDIVGEMYNQAYHLLNDLDITLETQQLLDTQQVING